MMTGFVFITHDSQDASERNKEISLKEEVGE